MTDIEDELRLPEGLSVAHRHLVLDVARRNDAAHGGDLLGLVLTGSAGRGLATERSDVDVYVVLTEAGARGRGTSRSASVDEIPLALAELEPVPPFGSEDWWYRWAFAWAPVLLDRADGRVGELCRRQAMVTDREAEAVLVEHDRLDGWLNLAYRALKNDRDGRPLERQLDAAESVPWLLDVVFTLAGRVRPYNKYLPWELREHPLPDWTAEELLAAVAGALRGDPAVLRQTFHRIRVACTAFDRQRPQPVLTPVIEDWGDELRVLGG